MHGLAFLALVILLIPAFYIILVHAAAFLASSVLRRKGFKFDISVQHVVPLPLPFMQLKGIRIAHYYTRQNDFSQESNSSHRNAFRASE
jgi:hypothetical protein